MRTAVGMGLVLVLVACGGKQTGAPAPDAAAPAEPVVASAAAPSPAATPVEAPVAPAASPPSDPPAATTGAPSDSAPVDTSSSSAGSPPPLGSGTGGAGTGRAAADLTAEAQSAAKAGQWGKALNLSEQALRARPDPSTKLTALTTAVLSACNLKNLAKAKQYYGQLPVARQAMIRQRCLANGVNVAP